MKPRKLRRRGQNYRATRKRNATRRLWAETWDFTRIEQITNSHTIPHSLPPGFPHKRQAQFYIPLTRFLWY